MNAKVSFSWNEEGKSIDAVVMPISIATKTVLTKAHKTQQALNCWESPSDFMGD